MSHLFISDGRLFIHSNDGIEEISSKFACEKAEEAGQSNSAHSWKTSEMNNPYWNSMTVWGGQAAVMPFVPYRFKWVMNDDANNIFYLLSNHHITGLFRYDLGVQEEQRIFHRNNFMISSIDFSRSRRQFAVSLPTEEGCTDIELLDENGRYESTLTAGDSRDMNPCFSRKNVDELLYQSAGIARNEQGFAFLFGPEAINKINISNGEITEVLSHEQYDYLSPKDDTEGNIYCIRRPYKGFGANPIEKLWYIVTFPVRFVIAFFKFLDAFSRLFNQKPFQIAGPNQQMEHNNKTVQVLGQTIELAKIRGKMGKDEDISLVPKNWEFIRITPDGKVDVLARNVSSFDIGQNGEIHYTNGFKVNLFSDNIVKGIFKHKIIENLIVVPNEIGF